jgi:thymidylate synthase ThyX
LIQSGIGYPENLSRVLTVGPLPAEKCAYALARYSRSPDSIRESLEWVRSHDSAKFLESFYFQYGHASIADLGHVVVCFEGVSELAAIEIEDEPLWDGQARSSRYQDFSKNEAIRPPELEEAQAELYREVAGSLLNAYRSVHTRVLEQLREQLPRPEGMKEAAYERNLAARAFDVARYLLFLGVPTGVGQVVSIRTLEKQIRRLKASPYREVREIAEEAAQACEQPPSCSWDERLAEPVAPTLAKYVDVDRHLQEAYAALKLWAVHNLGSVEPLQTPDVDLLEPGEVLADIAATLLYRVTHLPYRQLYEMTASWSDARKMEVLELVLASRAERDELLREFRGGPFVFDITMDLGAWRDLHRHRRCVQVRQEYATLLGYDTPEAVREADLEDLYLSAIQQAFAAAAALPPRAAEYILPFATRGRFLFKMDFAEAEYIARLRSGVKGHFSYRKIAWEMKQAMERLHPSLGRLIKATPPWVADPLKR